MTKEVQKIPFLRLTFALAAGIFTGSLIRISLLTCWSLSLIFITALLLINRYYKYNFSALFGTITCILYFIIGISVFTMYNRKPVFHEKGIYSSTVLDIPAEKENSVQTVLKLNFIIKDDRVIKTDEKISVLFGKNESASKIEPGDRVVFNKAPRIIENSNNPFEFNYKKYLSGKRIFRQLFLSDGEWIVYKFKSRHEPSVLAERIRMSLLMVYRKSTLTKNHQNILAALTLGYRGGLDPETRQVFASAGVIHVLAVSGLHVGIVFMVFSFCLGFLKLTCFGRVILLFFSVGSLWFFALLTGLSPSVSRAALMLSLAVVGRNLKRRANIYNTLAASAFLLLILNPNNLFDAGFQLSYAAVFGIVFIQPRIERIIVFRFRIMKYLWALLSVSVAAQVATFPFSVYYFNQFPAYFWISNLFIIPVVSVTVPLGFLLLAFSWCPLVFRFLSLVTDQLFDVVIRFLKIIEQMPYAVVQISLSETEIFFVCSFLLSMFFLIKTMKPVYIKAMLFSLFMILIISLSSEVAGLCRKEIIVYNIKGDTVVHLIKGTKNYIVSTKEIESTGYTYEIVIRTVRQLKLEKPLFLTINEEFKDDHLCIIKNILNFDGRIICIASNRYSLPGSLQPEIIIGTLKNLALQHISAKSTVTLITRVPLKEDFQENMRVHSLVDKGAYREKW